MKLTQMIEFDQIKELWSNYAVTSWAKNEILQIRPIHSEDQLRIKQRETKEAKQMIEFAGNPPIGSVEGIGDLLAAAEKGECLSPSQLEEVEKALAAVKRIKDYLNRCKALQISLPYYEENLDPLESIREQISLQIRSGRVDDYASKLLSSIRTEIFRTEERMKEKANQIIRSHKECMSDSFCTTRNGRLCVPVKKEYKFKVSGSVIEKSATGNTLFIEPTTIAKYYDELQLLKIDEENEERRILYTLTALVLDCIEQMVDNIKLMEKLDFIFSKAKLSIDMKAEEPAINTERRLVMREARHPLMDYQICVPLNITLGEGIQGIVITGPNTGGKTVSIKTVMLNCMMAQCGLQVTCKEADICMSSHYLWDIGDGQSLLENLSTFSAHITNVLDILKKVDQDSLVIMDELGSGTDPTEGMGIAIAVLEELRKSNCLFLVTTHYPEVKQYAKNTTGIVNARMTFDKENLKPLYQLVVGEAGESCALYIASRLGMPNNMLETAIKTAYGEEKIKKYHFTASTQELEKEARTERIQKKKIKPVKKEELVTKYHIGDSVMIYPDRKIGIVCKPINEKGVLMVQLQKKKIWINHKRVKLHVATEELYPEDYDFSIIFDSVEVRKNRHQMERKYTGDLETKYEE